MYIFETFEIKWEIFEDEKKVEKQKIIINEEKILKKIFNRFKSVFLFKYFQYVLSFKILKIKWRQ